MSYEFMNLLTMPDRQLDQEGEMEGLLTRYRPKTLGEVWGNDGPKERWRGFLQRKDFPHSIIVVGDFGTGKSTIAPIFCKDIIQNVPSGLLGSRFCPVGPLDYSYERMIKIVSSSYDGMCSPVVMFMDEAHRMGETRVQELFLTPFDNNKKLFCVYATTNMAAINEALRHRSEFFELELPSMDVLKVKIAEIAQKEQIPISAGPLEFLIEQADRNPRICLKNLESLYGCPEPITIDVIRTRISTNIKVING